MDQLSINKRNEAAAKLAIFGLKQATQVAAVAPISVPGSVANDARLKAERQKANAHQALGRLVVDHHENVVEDLDPVIEAEVYSDDEIEIRIGSKTVRITVE